MHGYCCASKVGVGKRDMMGQDQLGSVLKNAFRSKSRSGGKRSGNGSSVG